MNEMKWGERERVTNKIEVNIDILALILLFNNRRMQINDVLAAHDSIKWAKKNERRESFNRAAIMFVVAE